jgi:hypothetical protein
VVLSLVRAGVVVLGGYLRAASKDLIAFLQFSMGSFVQKFGPIVIFFLCKVLLMNLHPQL